MKILRPKQLFPKLDLGTSMPFIFPATELPEFWPAHWGCLASLVPSQEEGQPSSGGQRNLGPTYQIQAQREIKL